MNNNFNLIKEFSAHINKAKELFIQKYKPELFNYKTEEKLLLTNYQSFTASVFLLETFKSLLLNWDTGYGKTILCIYIIKNIFEIYPQWKIFIFVKSSLKLDPWMKNIELYIPPYIQQHITFIHYDLMNAEQIYQLKCSNIKPEERIFFIFDESHDFIKKFIPKEDKPQRRLSKLMELVIKNIDKPLNKTLLMSATPITNDSLEFNYMMKFLRNGNINLEQRVLDKNNEFIEISLLKKICIGLTSFQGNKDPDIFKETEPTDFFAGKKIIFVDLIMSPNQSAFYKKAAKLESKFKSKGFRPLKRMAVTLGFFDISVKSEMTNEEVKLKNKRRIEEFKRVMKEINFSKEFIEDFATGNIEVYDDTSLVHNLNFKVISKLDFTSNLSNIENKQSKEIEYLRLLNSFSCKYIKTCQLIKESKGKCLIIEEFVNFEGVSTLIEYLKKFNISYIEYTQRTKNTRTDLIKKFNDESNLYGEKIKCCIISSAGSEGISLNDIMTIIYNSMRWTWYSFLQFYGRGLRYGSHLRLPKEYRKVEIFITRNSLNDGSETVDHEIQRICDEKEKMRQNFNKLFIDCSIESINEQYPFVEPIIKENFYPLIKYEYDLERFKKEKISVIKELIEIYFTFDENNFSNYKKGYLDEKTNEVYLNSEHIGNLTLDDKSRKIFKVIDSKLIYLIN